MANFKPIKLENNELQRFQTGDTVGIDAGGTGAATEAGARTALGLEIGTDVQEHSTQLDVLGSWSAAGIIVGDGSGGFLNRQLATASASRITVTNPAGTAGNFTVDLATVGSAQVSGFYKFAYDAYGRVTSSTPVTTGDLTPLLSSTYAPINNPTFTGTVTLAGDPVSALQAAPKQYVDNLFASGGIPPFAAVKAKTSANITLSAPQTIDGVTLIAGDRVLVTNQTTGSQNGIYVVAAGAWTRATDADQSGEFTPARQVFVQNGSTFANTGWAVGNTSTPTIGTDTITFTQVSGAASYSPGNGLQLTGTVFSAVPVVGQITVDGSGIGLATSGITPGTYTKVTFDAYGRATVGATATPADIGAQPADSTLTALAAYNTNGLVVQTAADTFTGRTVTGTAGRVSVTNGNGVSGNPTIDLVTTGVTPGTYNSITVDAYGRATAGSTTATNSISEQMTNGEAGSIAIGRVVYVSGNNTVRLANANNIATAKAIGFVGATSISAAATGSIITNGTVEATTGQWDAVTGQSGGLTSGAEYFISNITAGALTTTAPSTGIHAPIGVAMGTTKLKIDVKRVVIL